MDILFAVIGVLIGGSLGYWWKGRSLPRPLATTSVWLFPIKESNLWRVSLEEVHHWLDPEPTLWTLPKHEHAFVLEKKHALQCSDGELIDIRCVIDVTPKRTPEHLESLLQQGSIDQLNDVSWVFTQLQSTLKTSTTLFKQESRKHWLSNPTELCTRWQNRLDDSLPHWHCIVKIEHISATSDEFYNTEDPVQQELLLSRTKQRESLAAIEERIRLIDVRIEEERYKQAQLEVSMAQTEQLDVKWSAFDNHLQKKRERLEREVHERIEVLRMDLRSQLGLVSDALTAELNLRTPPADLTESILEERNTMDSILDTAKERNLELMASVESADDTAPEDMNSADSSTPLEQDSDEQ